MATTSGFPHPFAAPSRLDPEVARARAETLFRAHARMVNGLCRGLLRDHAEAEDAAQQTFLSAYGALRRGSEPREPRAWLATIARNECLARIRTRMREALPSEGDPGVSDRDPLAHAIARADLDALWQAVSELPRQQRKALLLREFGGLSYEELGLALGVSVPAVESLLFRARARLRGSLKAAMASLNGAGAVSALRDLLPRLLPAGGAGKIAAVTVGAGVIAGGAVVGEQDLLRRPSPPPPAGTTAPAAVDTVPSPPASAPAPAVSSGGAPTTERKRRRPSRVFVVTPHAGGSAARDESRRSESESRDGGGGGDAASSESDGGARSREAGTGSDGAGASGADRRESSRLDSGSAGSGGEDSGQRVSGADSGSGGAGRAESGGGSGSGGGGALSGTGSAEGGSGSGDGGALSGPGSTEGGSGSSYAGSGEAGSGDEGGSAPTTTVPITSGQDGGD